MFDVQPERIVADPACGLCGLSGMEVAGAPFLTKPLFCHLSAGFNFHAFNTSAG